MLRCTVCFLLAIQPMCHSVSLDFSPKEKEQITEAWKSFIKDPTAGENILLEAIKLHPDAQKEFVKFSDVPLDKLKEEKYFKNQSNRTFAAVSKIVGDINDEEEIVNFIKQIGQRHKGRKVPVDDFTLFPLAVVKVMKKSMGSKLSLPAEIAMAKLMQKMVDIISQEYTDRNKLLSNRTMSTEETNQNIKM